MEMKMIINKIAAYALVCSSILLACGCSTTKETLAEAIFYPPSPDQPRLQYLTSVSDSSDLVPPMNAFKKFLLGDAPEDISGIVKPYGMAIQGTKLYVCDTIGFQVHVLDLEARTWEDFKPKASGKLQKPMPWSRLSVFCSIIGTRLIPSMGLSTSIVMPARSRRVGNMSEVFAAALIIPGCSNTRGHCRMAGTRNPPS